MTIQPVQFPLNIGTATELKIQVLEHTDNETSVNVHYHLEDTTKTTILSSGGSLPYRILYSNNIILEGQDYLDYKANSANLDTLIINLLGVVPAPVTPAAE